MAETMMDREKFIERVRTLHQAWLAQTRPEQDFCTFLERTLPQPAPRAFVLSAADTAALYRRWVEARPGYEGQAMTDTLNIILARAGFAIVDTRAVRG